jgi:hypothetical protein
LQPDESDRHEPGGDAMGRKIYISFKAEDIEYKNALMNSDLDCIHKSLNSPIQSEDEDYVMQRIRSDYLSDSTVTIHLIGEYGSENRGWQEQRFIKRELQASLYNSETNTKNGILGVVLPATVPRVFRGDYVCRTCGNNHRHVSLTDTTITEFSYNYFIPNGKCSHSEDDRYCVLTQWKDFIESPEFHIERAFEKRAHPIASKTKVRP